MVSVSRFIWFVLFVWLDETNQINKTNQIKPVEPASPAPVQQTIDGSNHEINDARTAVRSKRAG